MEWMAIKGNERPKEARNRAGLKKQMQFSTITGWKGVSTAQMFIKESIEIEFRVIVSSFSSDRLMVDISEFL